MRLSDFNGNQTAALYLSEKALSCFILLLHEVFSFSGVIVCGFLGIIV